MIRTEVRPDLPSGTVTFLFTDVEGSTRFLHELGAEGYAQALAEHRRLIREACARHDGVEVDTQGDAFFFAFPAAPDALAAAGEMTEALASGPIQIRIGLHTGTPLLTEEGYVGDDVHFAARVAASGHGGQVVVSSATAALFLPSDKVSQGISLLDLGEHRLKDIEGSVSIFQLGDGSFPPLKTISNTNLPRPASSFVGRERELQEILSRIEDGARLVTLTGPGGTGKTRLALEAASSLVGDYKAGVFWVGLASLRDPALVTNTIAQTLGAKDGLAEHIGEREMLLLLDNLEQVIEAAPELSSLLSTCPNLTLLVTSRELLRVSGEVEYPVPPLASPEAVALFCERAQVDPSEEIAELCARLDSLPLAVELAAARTKALSPAQILERLSGRLDLLKGGRDADPRQQTLRATIEWSYELLSPEEQQLFARLAVFAGGCTLEAAEEVCDADLDTLQSLVEKSLLRYTNERYWMLETIREYASERLDESPEMKELGRRQAEHYLSLAERRPEEPGSIPLRRLADEHDNMRVALSWFGSARETDCVLRLVCALADYWDVRGHLSEARLHVEAALATQAAQSPSLRAKVLAIASDFARIQGDVDGARTFCEESLALSRQLGDRGGVARALHELGETATAEEKFDSAVELFEEAIAVGRAAGSNAAGSVGNLGYVALLQGDYERARVLSEEALELFRERGHESGVVVALSNLADASLLLGRAEEARLRIRECLDLAGELGFLEVVASCLDSSAALLADMQQVELAARLTGAAHALREDINLSQTPAERRLHHRMHARLRAALGDDAVEDLHEEGRELDVEQAIALALAALD
jgi:predicted ATPase/class 3 adenylate cyclase